jgi:hypothetical protein
VALLAVLVLTGWSPRTTRHVAWAAVDFFPDDLARQVRTNHRRYDAGIRRGMAAPPSWRAGPPGQLAEALGNQYMRCREGLRKPIRLADLVEELGVLAVRVADANDPLAVSHEDPREPTYAADYYRYADAALPRIRLVHYGWDEAMEQERVRAFVEGVLARSRRLYPFIGDEFYRTGSLRSATELDDRSVAFGVAAVSLSHAMTDMSGMARSIWRAGGGLVPTPVPTPRGHVGRTITLGELKGGFPDRGPSDGARPAFPGTKLQSGNRSE